MTLKELRLKHHLTLKALSSHTGISLSGLCKYENGTSPLSSKSRSKLEQYFNEPIDAPIIITKQDYNRALKLNKQLQEKYNNLASTYNDLYEDYCRLKSIIKNIYKEVQYDGNY